MSRKREDLIGCKGTVVRSIMVIDAMERMDGSVDLRVMDETGSTYWTQKDVTIDLDIKKGQHAHESD
jgi:hypothetical protein